MYVPSLSVFQPFYHIFLITVNLFYQLPDASELLITPDEIDKFNRQRLVVEILVEIKDIYLDTDLRAILQGRTLIVLN
jgi:hypothetical protein